MRLISRRLLVCLIAGASIAPGIAAHAADPDKILRLASPDIETLDPHQFNDSPSRDIARALFEGLYEWQYLASPPRLSPVTAAALPAITDGGKTWTIRLKPGIYFIDDPAFGGKKRELVAGDYVYSLTRLLDPNLRRGGDPVVTNLLVGMRPVVDAARRPGASLDYNAPIEGLRALDRYTLQLRLTEINYPNIENILTTDAVAREVVEAAGGDIRERPVGTGPYRLKEWRRGSRLVFEANPAYRALRFPASSDPARAAIERSMEGKTLPQIGRVEVSIIEEDVPRLLEFDQGSIDYVVLRGEIATRLLAGGKLKPEFAARGVTRQVVPEPYIFQIYFNIADPVIGGMGNERVALRRAMALGFDTATLVDVLYAGQALPANQIIPPGVVGHDPKLPTKPLYDPAAAKALLDRFGYVALDGEGYRKTPDGKPLSVTMLLRSGAISREIQTLWKRNMDAIGLRTEFRLTPFQDTIKELEAGQFQAYFGGYGGVPSGYAELLQFDSREPPQVNVSRFKLPEYDLLMDRFLRTADSAEQITVARRMSELALTYAPFIPAIFRLENDFVQPWLLGYVPPIFDNYWKYLDIDLARQRKAKAR